MCPPLYSVLDSKKPKQTQADTAHYAAQFSTFVCTAHSPLAYVRHTQLLKKIASLLLSIICPPFFVCVDREWFVRV